MNRPHIVPATPARVARPAQQRKRARATIWLYALLAAILLFVLSVAALRYEELRADGVPATTVLGGVIFMTFVSLSPGLLSKEVFVTLVPLEELLRQRRLRDGYIKKAERKQFDATKALDQLALHRDWYRQERERLRAAYLLEYQEAGGTLENPYQ